MKNLVIPMLLVASVAFVPSGTAAPHVGATNSPAINGNIYNSAIINGVDTQASGFETTTVVARNGQLFLR